VGVKCGAKTCPDRNEQRKGLLTIKVLAPVTRRTVMPPFLAWIEIQDDSTLQEGNDSLALGATQWGQSGLILPRQLTPTWVSTIEKQR